MNKSERVVYQFLNNKITIEEVLERLLIISNDLNNGTLEKWVLNELNGYEFNDEVPEYRLIRSYNVIYSGINHSFQMKNAPLPITLVPKELHDLFNKYHLKDSVSVLERNAQDNKQFLIDLTMFAAEIEKYSGVTCYSIQKKLGQSVYIEIIRKIRTKVIQILLELEKEIGTLDNLEIDFSLINSVEVEKINTSIIKVFSEGREV